MMIIINFLLVYGITNILVNGSIFHNLRSYLGIRSDKEVYSVLHKVITCMMCCGFWVGLCIGFFCGPYTNPLFNGAVYSGTTWIIHCFTQFLGQGYDPARTINIVNDDGE